MTLNYCISPPIRALGRHAHGTTRGVPLDVSVRGRVVAQSHAVSCNDTTNARRHVPCSSLRATPPPAHGASGVATLSLHPNMPSRSTVNRAEALPYPIAAVPLSPVVSRPFPPPLTYTAALPTRPEHGVRVLQGAASASSSRTCPPPSMRWRHRSSTRLVPHWLPKRARRPLLRAMRRLW